MRQTAWSAPLALAISAQAGMAQEVTVTQWDQFAESGITAAGPVRPPRRTSPVKPDRAAALPMWPSTQPARCSPARIRPESARAPAAGTHVTPGISVRSW